MIISGDAVLNTLGDWASKRFQRVYTIGDFQSLCCSTIMAFKKYNPDILDEQGTQEISRYFGIEDLAKSIRRSITEGFFDLEDIVTMRHWIETGYSRVPNDMRRELDSCAKYYLKTRNMVASLRAEFDRNFPEELSEKTIEYNLRHGFENPGELAYAFDNMRKAIFLRGYFNLAEKDGSYEGLEAKKAGHNATNKRFNKIYQRMFAEAHITAEVKK